MNRTFSEGSRRLFRDTSQPITNALIVASVVLFLCDFLRIPISQWLDCPLPAAFLQPWRLLTYPIVTHGNIIGLIFNGLLLWQIGGSLERGWGGRSFLLFFGAITLLTAVAFGVATLFTGINSPSSYLVLAALFVGWATLNPDETINLYGIVPIKSRYLAVGACVIIFFTHGFNNPILGLLALSGCGLAVLWVQNGWQYGMGNLLPGVSRVPKRPNLRIVPKSAPKPKDDKFSPRDLNPMRLLSKRSERKKFEKLMRDD